MNLIIHCPTAVIHVLAFPVWLGSVTAMAPSPSSALPPEPTHDASPKAISGRTSYLPVRLAFHPYTQVIPEFCNTREFGPPVRVTALSPCPCVAHPVSCRIPATV